MPERPFLTNHALVLNHIANYSHATALELTNVVGITEGVPEK